jgi:hypothetical protein
VVVVCESGLARLHSWSSSWPSGRGGLAHCRLCDPLATATVLVIDDLQWADQGTINMLPFVLRRTHRCPLLVVGIARGGSADTVP